MYATTSTKQLEKPVVELKTPITYYGGKQNMLRHILLKIPDHKLYCEPFIGGAAVFFAKKPAEVEVINDTNRELINFYDVVQTNFEALEILIQSTLHSRSMHSDAKVVYNAPHLFSREIRAWAVWVMASMSFSSQLEGSFGYDRLKGSTTKKVSNKVQQFVKNYTDRLQNVQIECTDALRIIKSRDYENAFFYCDPPYYNSDCGHYDGYTVDDFESLLSVLSGIKGKFLLSSYPSPLLSKYIKENGWFSVEYEGSVSVALQGKHSKKKVEVLTANYKI